MELNLTSDMNAEQRFQQALEVISALQGQINELNIRISNQERISTPVPASLSPPVVGQVPRMHSLMSRPDKYNGDRKLATIKTFCGKMKDYLDCQYDLDESQKLKIMACNS
jgi:hypothetical protein